MGGEVAIEALRVPELEALRLARRWLAEPRSARPLPGYDDLNFEILDAEGRRWVLKIFDPAAAERDVELEIRALRHLEARGFEGAPRPLASVAGRWEEPLELEGTSLRARLSTWVEGVAMACLPEVSSRLLEALGGYLADLDTLLAEIASPGERLEIWDLGRLAEHRSVADSIDDRRRRRRVAAAMEAFLVELEGRRDALRRALIHGDANDHNVLVSSTDLESAVLAGLIDFGDMVLTETIFELAVAVAYAGMRRQDPWSAAPPLVAGYHRSRPLSAGELAMLLPAVRARLALSVSMAARRRRRGTADAYALVSEAGAWRALERLEGLSDEEALEVVGRRLERQGSS